MDKNANRKIGAAGVMRVKSELLTRGFDVAEPDVDCGVDLIAWDHRGINRIQVKATTQVYGKNSASFYTTRVVRRLSKGRASYDPREVDFIVCVSIPMNEFWVIPVSDINGEAKTRCLIGDEWHNKWFYLSKCNRVVGGDNYGQRRKLKYKIMQLEKFKEKSLYWSKRLSLENDILRCKLGHFHKYFKHRMDRNSVFRIERTSTPLRECEWDQLFDDERRYVKCTISSLERLYNRLNELKQPANGAWGDPMTVGFSADTVEVSPVPFLFPAHETKPD